MNSDCKLIEIEKVVRESRLKAVRTLPKFVIRILGRIIWEKEINLINSKLADQKGMDYVNGLLREWKVDVKTTGKENLPTTGRFIFVSNHPLGAIDGLSLLHLINSVYSDVKVPTNELFNYIPNLRPLIINVNVFGRNSKETAEKLQELFESDTQILIFPSGEVSRKINGVIEDCAWQKTFITKAIQHQRDIIPIFVEGRNSTLFYMAAKLRKLLKIKIFIETALLPNEMMRQRYKPITLRIGEVIPFKTFTHDKNDREWTKYVRKKVYGLKKP